MSAFRRFEEAQRRLAVAESNLEKVNGEINPFRTASEEGIHEVLDAFSKNGLFLDIDPKRLYSYSFPDRMIAKNRIDFSSTSLSPGDDIKTDLRAAHIVQEIVEAAQAQKIPLSSGQEWGHHIKVSEHIKEPEQYPSILLKGLAAYADSKGNLAMAAYARETAGKIEILATALQEIE